MKKAILGARLLLGLLFIVFGANYFIPFMPMPENPAEAQSFLGALFSTGYMFPLIKLTEIFAGVVIVFGFVPIGLILLSPVVVNIVAFHLFLAPGGLGLNVVIVGLMLFLAWSYKEKFAPLFSRVK